ncbi:S8 family serine peptidase [Phycisphaerales bacterium AB-hyl4]|uniref:S8 family serine peptidase n=1 Tax=Natronomicrosphaera hydrolytica TaxID=3242702 RepID=A0ABV4UCD3_9BACT
MSYPIWRWCCNGWTLTLLLSAAAVVWALWSPLPRASLAEQAEAVESAPPDRAELAGFTQAERRLGDDAPTGAGIVLGHVEGDPGQYLPRVDHHRYRRIDLRPRSGESEPLSHTDATARIIYGPQGLAHGIREVHHFSSPHWLGGGYLRAGQSQPPADDRPRVFNHSWIGNDSGMNPAQTAHILRRIDYAIDRHGVVMSVGVNNNRNSRVPGLLASAYNVIAVGLADGASSSGGTNIEVEGRAKPDIVAPGTRTSYSTPVVTAAVARMLEAAGKLPEHAESARRPETIKALLMAGATKPWNWRQRDGQVLDDRLGAGVVHLDNALRILEAGRAKPNEVRSGSGWDLRMIQPGGRAIYRLDLDEPVEELSIMLTWHRRIDGRTVPHPTTGQPAWVDTPALARFDLRVVHAGDEGSRLLADSLSEIDNVQHVHLTDAPAGDYHLVVSRREGGPAAPWPVAIAWRAGERVPYPGD